MEILISIFNLTLYSYYFQCWFYHYYFYQYYYFQYYYLHFIIKANPIFFKTHDNHISAVLYLFKSNHNLIYFFIDLIQNLNKFSIFTTLLTIPIKIIFILFKLKYKLFIIFIHII